MTIREFVQAGIHILPDGVTIRYHEGEIELREPMLMLIKKADDGKVSATYVDLSGYKISVPIKGCLFIASNSTGEILYDREEM